MRRVVFDSSIYLTDPPDNIKLVATLDIMPDLITYAYDILTAGNQSSLTHYVSGPFATNIYVEIRIVEGEGPSGKAFEIWVTNATNANLGITLSAFHFE